MAFLLNGHVDGKQFSKLVNGSGAVQQEASSIHCNTCKIGGTLSTAHAFCTSCFDFLCQKCKIQHNQSKTEHSIITKDLAQCGAFISLTKEISVAKQELVQTHNEAENNITLAERYRDKALEAIKKERENINKMLEEQKARINNEIDELETEVKDVIVKKYTADYDKFQAIIKDTESLKADLENITPKADVQQQAKDEDEFFTTVDLSKQELTEMKSKVRQAGAHNEVTKYRFSPKWEQNYTRMEITKLGTIQTLDSTKACAAVKPIPDINVRSPTDEESCSIKGMCFLSNHFFVVADSQNKSLKVLERENYQVVSTVAMPTGPREVTKVKENQIAVTLPSSKLIQVLNMTNSLARSHDIAVDGSCRGITYNNGTLVVSFDFPTRHIQILDMNGAVLQKIESGHSAEAMAGRSSYASIGISPNHKMIYIADQDRETVTCMTTKGKVKAVYWNRHLQTPRALTVDNHGFVYVSGKSNVHELSPDLSQGRIILDLSHGIQSVQSLKFCEKLNALYVGMLQQDKIKVFEIL